MEHQTIMDSMFAPVPVGAPLAPSDDALLAALLASQAPPPAALLAHVALLVRAERLAWATPARLGPVRARCRPAPHWATTRIAARPLAAAAALLLAGGIVAASIGVTPARAQAVAAAGASVAAPVPAARAAVSAPAAAVVAPAGALTRLHPASARDAALLAGLLAVPVAGPPAAPSRPVERDGLAGVPASDPLAAPAAVSFATVARLPDAALAAPAVAAVPLPMVTLAHNVIPPPPPPPPTITGQGQQPPPPPGYVQPPGYQDGVPFGGQPGAVPGTAASRPVARPTASFYVVRAGDTLAAIALRFYGDASRAALIWDANYRLIGVNPNRILPGQRLTLPGLIARPTVPLPARGPIAQRAEYTIQPRDYLRWIAERAYGNEVFWPEIFRANRNVLGPNPDLIYPGVTVYIP